MSQYSNSITHGFELACKVIFPLQFWSPSELLIIEIATLGSRSYIVVTYSWYISIDICLILIYRDIYQEYCYIVAIFLQYSSNMSSIYLQYIKFLIYFEVKLYHLYICYISDIFIDIFLPYINIPLYIKDI